MSYPTVYSNSSHEHLLAQNLSNTNVVLFLSSSNIKHGLPKLQKLLDHIKTANDYLVIYAEDIPLSWLSEIPNDIYKYEAPTENQFLQIDDFLKSHADKELIASCSAGTYRSGFVHFYLDVIHNHVNHLTYNPRTDRYSNGGSIFDENTYRSNSLLTHYAKKHMSQELLNRIAQIPTEE